MRIACLAASILLTSTAAAQFVPGFPPISLGPFGGSCSAVLVKPNDPSIVLVLKNWGELFRSTDSGVTFDAFGTGVPAAYNDELTSDPSNPNIVYMLSGQQVLRSLDFGANWNALPLTPSENFNLKKISISSTGNEILVTGAFNVYRSGDGGSTWSISASVVPFGGNFFEDVVFAPSNPAIAYCSLLIGGVHKSTDGGLTFADAGPYSNWVKILTVSPANADVVFAGTPFADKVMKSIDGAATFNPVHNGLASSQSSQFFRWTFDGSTLWFGHLGGIVKTSNLGASWDDANLGIPTQNTPLPNALALDTLGNAYLGANGGDINDQAGGGLYKRQGANAWVHVGFLEVNIQDVAITGPGGKRLVGIGGGVYAGDPGAEVLPTVLHYDFGSDTRTVAVDPNDPHRWIAGGVGSFLDNAQLFLLTQDGAQAVKTYEKSGAGRAADLAFDPHTPGRALASLFPASFGLRSILVSTDSGASWNEVPGTENWASRSIAYDPFTPGRVLQLSATNQWSSSLDGGSTWLPLQPAWPGTGFGVFLVFDPFIPNVLYRGETGQGLWRSDDGGVQWSPLGIRLHDGSGLAVNLDVPGMIFVSDSLGNVKMSTNRGQTFTNAWDVHLAALGTGMVLDRGNGNLIVGTTEASLWELPYASPVYSYGEGSPGCQGTQWLTVNEAPLVNTPTFALTSHAGPASSLGLGLVTDAADVAGSDPFAIGVKLHVDLFAATEVIPLDFVSDLQGTATLSTPIPGSPALAGKTYYAMTLWGWSSCALPPFNLSSSRGLALTIRN
jgi:photosystem II stability/assembly factor-like uncharacterized protein